MNVRSRMPAVLCLGTEGHPEAILTGAGAYDAAAQRWVSANGDLPWQLTCTTNGGDHESHETDA